MKDDPRLPRDLALLQHHAKNSPLERVENLYWNGSISRPVFEAYCHLWRTSAFRFSVLCIGYENFDHLPSDTQALVAAFRESEAADGE